MRHYCTLFDSNYLAKGLVMAESLAHHSSEPYTLHILAMDHEAARRIYEFQLPNVEIMWLSNFEMALHLEPVKQSRTWKEYCWTCASSLMEYLMPWFGEITYLDADLYFFSDPAVVHAEIGSREIAITPHRFPARLLHYEKNGRFNVGWVTAKPTPAGIACIATWAKNCRDWCFARNEGAKFGDQRYLDSWERDYPGRVCAIENIGVNLAPWNCERWPITEGPLVDGKPVVFYHLHEFLNPNQLTNYPISDAQRRLIYEPYCESWRLMNARIEEVDLRLAEAQRLLEMEAESV